MSVRTGDSPSALAVMKGSDLRLDKITSRHIQQFINDLALNGKSLKNGKPLSRKTAIHHLSFISDVFSYAVRMDLVAGNPCRKVTIPKGEVKEKPIYSQEEIAQLLTAINGEPTKYRAFFFLIAYSGFRRGEILGTKWQDYDRLFVKWDGRPMNNNTPYFWLREFCEANNFRFCDIHSLRHFYAFALINKGVDAAAVSGALGHSTVSTTSNIYCHMLEESRAKVSDAVSSALDFSCSKKEPKGA